MTNQLSKEDLEKKKLETEIHILAQQKKWEFWKSLSIVIVPFLTLLTLIGGSYKYFHDEEIRQQLRREEVFSLSLKNLESKEEYVRLGAVISILTYVGEKNGYDGQVAAVLAIHEIKETKVIVKKTILGNLRKWKQQDQKMFNGFLESVKDDLQMVAKNLQAEADAEKRKSLEQEKYILEQVEKLLAQL